MSRLQAGLVWLLVTVAASGSEILTVPFGTKVELASPTGRQVLFLKRPASPANQRPELYLGRTAEPASSRRILAVNRTALAQWSPDGKRFYITDQSVSSSSESHVYDESGEVVLEAADALLRADSSLQRFARAGHLYVEARGWIDPDTVRVYWFGHTDGPVTCFTFEYALNVNGTAKRLKQHVEKADAKGCSELPE